MAIISNVFEFSVRNGASVTILAHDLGVHGIFILFYHSMTQITLVMPECFQSDCTYLYFYQQCIEFQIFFKVSWDYPFFLCSSND